MTPITINISGNVVNLILLGIVLLSAVYVLILRVDVVQQQRLSNWLLSRKAQLIAGRAAYAKSQLKLSGVTSRKSTDSVIVADDGVVTVNESRPSPAGFWARFGFRPVQQETSGGFNSINQS